MGYTEVLKQTSPLDQSDISDSQFSKSNVCLWNDFVTWIYEVHRLRSTKKIQSPADFPSNMSHLHPNLLRCNRANIGQDAVHGPDPNISRLMTAAKDSAYLVNPVR